VDKFVRYKPNFHTISVQDFLHQNDPYDGTMSGGGLHRPTDLAWQSRKNGITTKHTKSTKEEIFKRKEPSAAKPQPNTIRNRRINGKGRKEHKRRNRNISRKGAKAAKKLNFRTWRAWRLGASKSYFWIATGHRKICASRENFQG
jgi:hypothetical protein